MIVGYTRDLLGEDKVQELPGGMGSEDFSPGHRKGPRHLPCAWRHALRPEKVSPPITPMSCSDESAFPIGSAVHANAAIQWLKTINNPILHQF